MSDLILQHCLWDLFCCLYIDTNRSCTGLLCTVGTVNHKLTGNKYVFSASTRSHRPMFFKLLHHIINSFSYNIQYTQLKKHRSTLNVNFHDGLYTGIMPVEHILPYADCHVLKYLFLCSCTHDLCSCVLLLHFIGLKRNFSPVNGSHLTAYFKLYHKDFHFIVLIGCVLNN